MTKRALVTGAAGFVGAVLSRKLIEDGHDVHAVVSKTGRTTPWRLRGLDLPLHRLDLAEPDAVSELVRRSRPEWIFHLAAHGAYSSQTSLRRMVESNVLGTLHLVNACLSTGFEAFVNTGSSSEYGFTDHAPLETEPCRPASDYAVTKLTATLYCRAAARRERVHLPTLRLYSVYGPFEEPSRFVPTLAVQGIGGALPPLVRGDVARDFVFVDDVVDAFLRAAAHPVDEPGAVFNVGTGRQTTIAEAVAVARELLSIEEEPRFATMPDRSWDTTCWVSNPERIRRELGWEPHTSFLDGFRRTVTWLREDPARLDVYRSSA